MAITLSHNPEIQNGPEDEKQSEKEYTPKIYSSVSSWESNDTHEEVSLMGDKLWGALMTEVDPFGKTVELDATAFDAWGLEGSASDIFWVSNGLDSNLWDFNKEIENFDLSGDKVVEGNEQKEWPSEWVKQEEGMTEVESLLETINLISTHTDISDQYRIEAKNDAFVELVRAVPIWDEYTDTMDRVYDEYMSNGGKLLDGVEEEIWRKMKKIVEMKQKEVARQTSENLKELNKAWLLPVDSPERQQIEDRVYQSFDLDGIDAHVSEYLQDNHPVIYGFLNGMLGLFWKNTLDDYLGLTDEEKYASSEQAINSFTSGSAMVSAARQYTGIDYEMGWVWDRSQWENTTIDCSQLVVNSLRDTGCVSNTFDTNVKGFRKYYSHPVGKTQWEVWDFLIWTKGGGNHIALITENRWNGNYGIIDASSSQKGVTEREMSVKWEIKVFKNKFLSVNRSHFRTQPSNETRNWPSSASNEFLKEFETRYGDINPYNILELTQSKDKDGNLDVATKQLEELLWKENPSDQEVGSIYMLSNYLDAFNKWIQYSFQDKAGTKLWKTFNWEFISARYRWGTSDCIVEVGNAIWVALGNMHKWDALTRFEYDELIGNKVRWNFGPTFDALESKGLASRHTYTKWMNIWDLLWDGVAVVSVKWHGHWGLLLPSGHVIDSSSIYSKDTNSAIWMRHIDEFSWKKEFVILNYQAIEKRSTKIGLASWDVDAQKYLQDKKNGIDYVFQEWDKNLIEIWKRFWISAEAIEAVNPWLNPRWLVEWRTRIHIPNVPTWSYQVGDSKRVSKVIIKELNNYGSKIKPSMVIDASNKHGVPWDHIMAFMRNDSHYSTKGKWSTNNNPWNIAQNDAMDARWITVAWYETMWDWVDAVWEYLAWRIRSYMVATWSNEIPSAQELAHGVSNGGIKFYWEYMTTRGWPESVQSIVNELRRLV